MTDPKNLENWLHEKASPAYDALKADPARTFAPDQVRERLASEHAKRQEFTLADQQCIAVASLSPPESSAALRRAMARRNELLTPYDPAEDLTCMGSVVTPLDNHKGNIMKQNIVILAVLSVATLTACGSKTDANEKNFRAAMTKYFDEKGDLCLNIKRWPVDLSEMDLRLQKTMQAGIANQMAALEAAGLVKGEETEVDATGYFTGGGKRKVKRYTLTDAAKPFVQEKEIDSIGLNGMTKVKQTDLCWGKKALDKIVKWEGPKKFGDYQEALITYTYKVNNVADWAKKPEVQAAFPFVKSVLDGVGSKESKHVVKLTSQGWEAKGLD